MEQNVLEIVRPAKTTVTIYGQVYEVRRIRYPAMIRIVAMVADVAIKGGLLERIREKFVPLIKICKEYGTAMRIGK